MGKINTTGGELLWLAKKNKEAQKKQMYEFANDQLGENKDPSYNPLNNKEKKSKKK